MPLLWSVFVLGLWASRRSQYQAAKNRLVPRKGSAMLPDSFEKKEEEYVRSFVLGDDKYIFFSCTSPRSRSVDMTTATHWISQVVVVISSAPGISEGIVGLKNWRAKARHGEVGCCDPMKRRIRNPRTDREPFTRKIVVMPATLGTAVWRDCHLLVHTGTCLHHQDEC